MNQNEYQMLKSVVSETSHEQMDGRIWLSLCIFVLCKELITMQLIVFFLPGRASCGSRGRSDSQTADRNTEEEEQGWPAD
jgi:hypothetical protein